MFFVLKYEIVSGSGGTADALGSGSSTFTGVWVQIPPSALKGKKIGRNAGLLVFCMELPAGEGFGRYLGESDSS